MINKNKQYTTCSGLPVRIYATDCGGDYPVHGAILAGRDWISLVWSCEGRYHIHPNNDSSYDLIEVKPRIQRTVWFNVYRDTVSGGYETLEEAQWRMAVGCIARIKLEIDCEEGEGL